MRGNKVDTVGEEKNGDLLLEASGDLARCRCKELDLSKLCGFCVKSIIPLIL